jgi:TolB protein
MKLLFASAAALLLCLSLSAQSGSAGSTSKWTPDGNHILFTDGEYPQGREVFIMNADGTERRQLTKNNLGHEYPSLNPNGKTILFSSYRTGKWKLYVMNPDRSDERDLGMEPTATDVNDPCRADWSPDGKQFVFPQTKDGKRFLHVANADGTGVREIPNGRGLYPHWARDGQSFVFFAANNIHTINLDGTNRRQLTNNPADAPTQPNYPQWSADGRVIYYLHGEHIFRINPDGTGQAQVTNIPGRKWYLGMSTKGKLVYGCIEDKLDRIYTLDPDGSHATRVTN